jgi:hypothetical protein
MGQAQMLADFPTVEQIWSRSTQFRRLDIGREGNGPRIPDRPPSRLTEIRSRPHPASFADSISEERSAATRAPRSDRFP